MPAFAESQATKQTMRCSTGTIGAKRAKEAAANQW